MKNLVSKHIVLPVKKTPKKTLRWKKPRMAIS